MGACRSVRARLRVRVRVRVAARYSQFIYVRTHVLVPGGGVLVVVAVVVVGGRYGWRRVGRIHACDVLV